MKIKLNKSEYWILLEALRRYLKFNQYNQSITECWTGLETSFTEKSTVEKGYMNFIHGNPYKRCLGWLKLTQKGSKIIEKWIEEGYTELEFVEGLDWEYPTKNGNLPGQLVEIDLLNQ